MATNFFIDLPNTTTPLTATRLNGLLNGNEALGNIVVDGISTKNIFNKNQLIGLVQINSSGQYVADQTSYINYIEVEEGATYTISANLNRQWVYNFSNSIPNVGASGSTRVVAGGYNVTFTVPSGYKYFCVRGYPNGNSSQEYNLTQNVQLEKGSTATTYTPYQNLNETLNNYSTQELVIGKWIDGKPLYRNVFSISSPQTSNTNYVNVSSLNISSLIHLYGYYKSTSGNIFDIPFYDSESNYSVIFLSDTGYIRGRFGAPSNIAEIKVIIEYTKSTD